MSAVVLPAGSEHFRLHRHSHLAHAALANYPMVGWIRSHRLGKCST